MRGPVHEGGYGRGERGLDLGDNRALRTGKLLDAEWTAWAFHADAVKEGAGYELGVAGGGPGVSAGYESDGDITSVVLANLDPPAGEGLAVELYRALASRRGGEPAAQ